MNLLDIRKNRRYIQVPKDEMYLGLRFKTEHIVQNYHIV